MKLGITEILVILVVILFVIGPDKIPDFAKKIAEALKAFKTATSGVTKEIRENVIDPLNEAQAPLREAMAPIAEIQAEIGSLTSGIKQDAQEIANSLNEEVKGITQDVNQTGNEIKLAAEKAMKEAKAEVNASVQNQTAEFPSEEKPASEAPLPETNPEIPDEQSLAASRVAEAEKALEEARQALALARAQADETNQDISKDSTESEIKEETT